MADTAKRLIATGLLLWGLGCGPASALDLPPRAAPTTRVEVYPLPPPGWENFSPEQATADYLASVPPAQKARSDAYFEGGYWLTGLNLLFTLALAGGLLWSGISARLRDFAATLTRRRFWQTPIYVGLYAAITGAAWIPLTVYEDYLREHAYGLSNLDFFGWAGETLLSFALTLVAAVVLLTLLYALARRLGRHWWAWGAGVTVAFIAFTIAVQPVLVAPLFNRSTPLPAGALKTSILAVTQSSGVPAQNVYVYDQSRQTDRISANVSGFLGTTRISLNDNLLKCPPAEILAVVGHETGHYVMNHVAILLTWIGLMMIVLFWLVDLGFRALADVFGGNWGVRTIDDPAGLPLVVALFSLLLFLATPVTNTITRTAEQQADVFGLNAVRQPDAFAKVTLRLANYRKLDPSPLEEFWFYDHPSGKTRILTAMRWKKAHLFDADIIAGPISP